MFYWRWEKGLKVEQAKRLKARNYGFKPVSLHAFKPLISLFYWRWHCEFIETANDIAKEYVVLILVLVEVALRDFREIKLSSLLKS